MAATPPPAGRIRTPPTPLHGPKFDSFEPYSPRRSSRLASKSTLQSPQQHLKPRIATPRSSRTSTARTSTITLSPPSSPASPSNGTLSVPRTRKAAASTSRQHDLLTEDFSKAALKPSVAEPGFGMLPTPVKTPRKRALPNQAALKNTARVLFPSRPATVDDAMPSPRKHKQNHIGPHSSFSISALAEDGDDEASSQTKIQIYTDSKERIPTMDRDGGENPFLSKNAAGKKKVIEVSHTSRRKVKQKSEKDLKIEEAARKNEGMIYVFRGRKMFRKFDEESAAVNEEDEDTLSDLDIKRRAGPAADRPFTRSSVNPRRLLFPNEEQRREREQRVAEEADEEALTDIDMPEPTHKITITEDAPSAKTPRKTAKFNESMIATPPTTQRTTRKKDALAEEAAEAPATKKKRPSPFAGWSRTKAASRSASRGTKREGSPMELDVPAKRTRSGTHAAPSSV